MIKDVSFHEINDKNSKEVQHWLSTQVWYAYDNDLPFINDFWKENFNAKPQIMAKYVFPSLKDIIFALETNKGFTVLPDYLCKNEIKRGSIKQLFTKAKQPPYKVYWVQKGITDYRYEINLLIKALSTKATV